MGVTQIVFYDDIRLINDVKGVCVENKSNALAFIVKLITCCPPAIDQCFVISYGEYKFVLLFAAICISFVIVSMYLCGNQNPL